MMLSRRLLIARAALAAILLTLSVVPFDARAQAPADKVQITDAGKTSDLLYANVQMRTAVRGMGFGGVAQYAVLPGAAAALRTSASPSFVVAVPNNAQPQGFATLASLAQRPNSTREVAIGGGYMSYSVGVVAERVVQTVGEKRADQSGAPAGMTLYTITPAKPLARGEYALIVSTSAPNMPAGPMMSSPLVGRYYDFGVD